MFKKRPVLNRAQSLICFWTVGFDRNDLLTGHHASSNFCSQMSTTQGSYNGDSEKDIVLLNIVP
jgi:hypothetical protein